MHLDRFKKSSLFLLEYFSRLISIVNMKGIIMFPPVTVILGKYSIRKHLKISLNLELLSIPIGSFKFSWQLVTRWNFTRSKLEFLTRSKLFQKHSQDQKSHFNKIETIPKVFTRSKDLIPLFYSSILLPILEWQPCSQDQNSKIKTVLGC